MLHRIRKNGAQNLQIFGTELIFGTEFWRH